MRKKIINPEKDKEEETRQSKEKVQNVRNKFQCIKNYNKCK